MVTFPMTMTDP